MLPPVVIPWIRLGHIGASDYNLDALVVHPTGKMRMIRNIYPRAATPDGRWIGIDVDSQKPIAVGSGATRRPGRLIGPFMTEPDFGGELAFHPRLRLVALAGRGQLLLQRWQNGVGGRIVARLSLPDGARVEPSGIAWHPDGRLLISGEYGPGWLYALRKGRMRLLGRPRIDGAAVGWVGDRVLVHQNANFYDDSDVLTPRLMNTAGKTLSIGPKALGVGTDGRHIVLVTSRPNAGKRWAELLSWHDANWRRLSRPVPLPTTTGAEYDELSGVSVLYPLTTGR